AVLSFAGLGISGGSGRVHRAQGQELLRSSHLSHAICRGLDWFGARNGVPAYLDLDEKHLCGAGGYGGRVVAAVFCARIVAGKLSSLSKSAGLAAAGDRAPA